MPVRYCGVAPAPQRLQLAMLEELRGPEPPVRLAALFFEPADVEEIAAEVSRLDDVVVAMGAPPAQGAGPRACELMLRERGVHPHPPSEEAAALHDALAHLGVFRPPPAAAGETGHAATEGPVPEGAYRESRLLETNADAVFCSLRGQRVPARRHPMGVRIRLEALSSAGVVDQGGELWHRRIEEVDAAAAAVCAHRYAVAHACWLGSPEEGVVVLPGSAVPARFDTAGVLPPVERIKLPPAG